MPAVPGKRNLAVIALALLGAAIALLVLRFGPAPSPAKAASHREAPLISNAQLTPEQREALELGTTAA